MIRIVIDPGHGGTDRANRGKNGYIEADGVLSISLHLKSFLEAYDGVTVLLTRDKDKSLTLWERGSMYRDVDLFISEHTNGGGGTARGTETLYGVNQPHSKKLAQDITTSIADTFKVPNRGAKTRANSSGTDYYGVIRAAVANGAKNALIVEALFHDNVQDESILLKDSNLELIALEQSKVIASFFNLKLKPTQPQIDKPSAWADTSWTKSYNKSILDGTNPQAPVTREQLAVVLDRLGLLDK